MRRFSSMRRKLPGLAAAAGFTLPVLGWKYHSHTRPSTASCEQTQAPSPTSGGKLVILGSGIAGLTTAYFMSRTIVFDEIHVVDRYDKPGMGASFQNGGVINVESIVPVNVYMSVPGTFVKSLQYMLFGTDTNTLITWKAFLEPPGLLLRWLWYFYKNTDEASVMRNSIKMAEIGQVTERLFPEVVQALGLDAKAHNFFPTPGLVLLHADDPEATVASKKSRFDHVRQKTYLTGQPLQDVIQESSLLGIPPNLYNVGCVESDNLVINTYAFMQSLRRHLEAHSVKFHFSTGVSKLVCEDNRMTAVALEGGGQISADTFILCGGYETTTLLRGVGVSLPLAACKAYSLHIRNAKIASALKYATHLEASVACLVTPYRDEEPPAVRVTGIRDLDGFNDVISEDRAGRLMEMARRFVGTDFDPQKDVTRWTGVMAVSPDDFPLVGRVQRFQNLYINVGHGFRGTNWSVATAKFLSEMFSCPHKTCLDPESLAPSRFGV